MRSRGKWMFALSVLLIATAAFLAMGGYRRIAIMSAPEKRDVTSRSLAALTADSMFWHTFHGAQYDQIQPAIDALARAYVATPNDATTAAHLAWLHIWRISEHLRRDSDEASITEDMYLARRYFEEAVRLDPSDARKLGFLASARMGEGSIQHDERLVRTGYFTMLDAINAWPAFNLFTAGYVVSGAPADSKQFHEGLEWEWKDLDVCTGQRVDRTNPDLTKLMSLVKDRRACLNTWIAPHNGEGFFLNAGDMLVKAGDWKTAQIMYANARLLPEYPSWKFAPVLDDRIKNAQANVARFSGRDPDAKTGLMTGSAFSCMACHQQ